MRFCLIWMTRCTITWNLSLIHILNVVGVENYEEAEIAAKEMAAKGCKAIELCAGFGYEGVARVKKAVGPDIAVGAVKFDCHPAFGYKSGDEMFQ